MIRRTWQSGMIALARSKTAKVAMQSPGAASAIASRFVAGVNPEEAVDRATALHVSLRDHGNVAGCTQGGQLDHSRAHA
jgi:hypothetical protein